MSDRYFSAAPITADRVTLSGAEAHHLIHVMRAKAAMRVTLWDGSGCEFAAVVERMGRAEVELTVISREEIDRELSFELTLGVALPKGDRQKWLVEKAVELGVSRIVPLETARGVAQPVDEAVRRLRRTVIEASKQCGRNRLMEIAAPQAWSRFVVALEGAARRLVAHPRGERSAESGEWGVGSREWGVGSRVRETHRDTANEPGALHAPQDAVALAVGPEGGFTDEEIALARAAGWQTVDLGPRILRVETAAILLAATASLASCNPAAQSPRRQ
jgi:16S rRNA (uracil1498-N3)-methyltransferase